MIKKTHKIHKKTYKIKKTLKGGVKKLVQGNRTHPNNVGASAAPT